MALPAPLASPVVSSGAPPFGKGCVLVVGRGGCGCSKGAVGHCAHLQRSVTSAPSSTAIPIPSTACSASACRTARALAAPPHPSSPRLGASPAAVGSAAAAGEQERLTAGGLGEPEEALNMATCWRTTATAVWTVCVKERGLTLGSMALRRGGVSLTDSCRRAANGENQGIRGWGGSSGWRCCVVVLKVFQVLLTGTIEQFGM